MNWLISLIMFILVTVSSVIMFFLGFPENPGKRKMIFGVRDNPKFHEGEAAEKVNEIVRSCRKSALIITLIICLASVILLFLPVSNVTILAWTLLVYALFTVAIPFGKGNKELKGLKKELGITKSGTVYADLSSAGIVHGLKLPRLLIPNCICLVTSVFAVFIDLGVIRAIDQPACDKYALTGMNLSFLFLGVLVILIAVMLDNARNTVISKDSNINANYSRAKKKAWADMLIAMSWANALFAVSCSILYLFLYNDIAILISTLAYTIILMAVVAASVKTQAAVEKRYARDTDLELLDDDDNWVFGMFYYNPNDTRLNVEKRFGYGGTVNIAHPAGKVIMIIIAVLLIASVAFIIWAACTGQMIDPSFRSF